MPPLTSRLGECLRPARETFMNLYDSYNAGMLIIRLVVGLTLVAHGYNHLFGGGRIEGAAR